MGIFKEDSYKKDKNGKWKLVKTQIVKAPHDLGRWERSAEMDLKNGKGCYTNFQAEVTKSGLNKKVTSIVSIFGKNEKVERKLITTSNKLSIKDKKTYKGIKGYDKPITR